MFKTQHNQRRITTMFIVKIVDPATTFVIMIGSIVLAVLSGTV
jgi:hypothetical protein